MKPIASALVTGILGFAGCATEPSGPEVLPDLTVPDAPDNGVQVITPIVHDLVPGSDTEMCTWTDVFIDEDTDVKSTISYQTEPPGHHMVVYYTTDTQPPNTTRECTDTDMASFRFLTGGGANGEMKTVPGDLVYRIPAGAQLVVNHHYLNATDDTLDGQSMININFAAPGTVHVPSGSIAFLDTNLHVQPGHFEFDTECDIDRQFDLWYAIPHMHQWGSNIQINLIQNGESKQLFDTPWDPSFTFEPPAMELDPSQPMTVKSGDKLQVHCEFDNDSGRVLDFGFEMCVAYAQFVDADGLGSWACNNNHWDTF